MFGTFSTLETGPEGPSKRKRQQVLRACDSCRIKRSKCDDGTPCSSCDSRGWICSRTRFSSQPTSLASALIQISTLEERIRVLESRPSVASAPRTIQDLADWAKIDNRRLSQWENDDFLNSDSDSSTYFGPLSTARITAWMKRYLNSCPERSPFESAFHYQLLPTNCRQPRRLVESTLPRGQSPTSPMDSEIIPKSRQLQYIHHFWHFQHPLLPILCEKDFTEEFGSIWATETPMRRSASALADIMIAAGALAQSLRSNRATIRASHSLVDDNLRDWTHGDVSVWHYHRCRRLLDDELEASMLSTVQSHIVLSVYLYNASRPSAAYNALGTAVRIAYSLGLHQDPPAVIGVTKQELRRRIWWSLYILDIRLSIELGRPAIIHLGESDCQFPGDDVETARMACQQPFASTPEVTWLTYTVQLARLFAIVQSINVEIYKANNNHESSSMLNAQHLPPRNPASELLEIHLHHLQAWAEALPNDLRLARTGDEPSMSPKFSGIQIDIYAPRWLQYQRVFLELLYHDAVVSLIRPVALLGKVFGQPKSLIDEIMYQLDGHTNTIIRACHQLYLETDLLTDHPELSSIMWNAAVTTLSRLLSVPGDHDVAKRLAIVAEMFQDLDGVDQNTLLALTNVRKVPHLSRWTPESLPSTAKSAANESSSVNDGANHLGVEHSMSGEVYSVTEVGPPSPTLEWGHSAAMMDSSLWFNDPTWLEG